MRIGLGLYRLPIGRYISVAARRRERALVKHLEVDGWSRRSSPLHRLDARAKLAAVLVTLAFIGSARPWTARHAIFYADLAVAAGLVNLSSSAVREVITRFPVTA